MKEMHGRRKQSGASLPSEPMELGTASKQRVDFLGMHPMNAINGTMGTIEFLGGHAIMCMGGLSHHSCAKTIAEHMELKGIGDEVLWEAVETGDGRIRVDTVLCGPRKTFRIELPYGRDKDLQGVVDAFKSSGYGKECLEFRGDGYDEMIIAEHERQPRQTDAIFLGTPPQQAGQMQMGAVYIHQSATLVAIVSGNHNNARTMICQRLSTEAARFGADHARLALKERGRTDYGVSESLKYEGSISFRIPLHGPTTRFVFDMPDGEDQEKQRRITDAFKGAGIPPERIVFSAAG